MEAEAEDPAEESLSSRACSPDTQGCTGAWNI